MAHPTPGPWMVSERGTIYALNDDARPNNRFDAQLNAGWIDRNTRTPAEEIMANALLMGAAPDLATLGARAARQLEANAVCLNDPVFKAKTLALAEEIRSVLRAAGIDPDGGA